MLLNSPNNPTLRDHALQGALYGYRAISITGDIRLIYYYVSAEIICLYDIGTHNQVY